MAADHPHLMARSRVAIAVTATLCLSYLRCASPTMPDERRGYAGVHIICDGFGANPLLCRAETYCGGWYGCPEPFTFGRDVTASATWTNDDPTVARVIGPGRIEGVALGDTVNRARL